MKKKMGTTGFTAIIALLVIAGLGYYTYLNNRSKDDQESTKGSETEKLLNYDFENNYPKTVRETVKLHCNYLKNVYNESFTEDDLFIVNKNIRQLFDEELLAINTEDEELQGMKDELQLYKENKQKIVSFSLAEGSQVEYNTENDIEYAKIKVTLVLKIDFSTVSVEEEYILRKDSEKRWKILGWQPMKNSSSESEGDTSE